jgi:hypothetical protein
VSAGGLLVGRVVSLPALSVMLKQSGQDSRSDRLGGLVLTAVRAWQAQAGKRNRPSDTHRNHRAFASGIVTRRAETREAGLG